MEKNNNNYYNICVWSTYWIMLCNVVCCAIYGATLHICIAYIHFSTKESNLIYFHMNGIHFSIHTYYIYNNYLNQMVNGTFYAYRKISTIKGMNNKGLVANVDDPADPVTRMKGGTRPRIILNCAMIVAVFNVLQWNESKWKH